jgi:hypothetical protein
MSSKRQRNVPKTAPREGTIKALVFARLAQGRKPKTIVTEVRKKFPRSRFKLAHLPFYKSIYKSMNAA